MRLLDLFCCAGGAAMGYHRAGFEVVGIDIINQRRYPFEFIRGDVTDYFGGEWMASFDAIHASPPCQAHSRLRRGRWADREHRDLIAATRDALRATGRPYIIENVVGAPLIDPVRLCGSSFGLDIQRHRLFESNIPLSAPPCNHAWQTPRFKVPDKRKQSLACVVPVYGNTNYAGEVRVRGAAMGIDWMTNSELSEAIPPAFTEFLGRQLYAHIRAAAGEAVA